MINITCPCCGNHMGELPEPEKVKRTLPKYMVPIFDAILSSGVEGISTVDLSVAVYGVKSGGEEKNMKRVQIYMLKLKKMIEPFGYMISNGRRGIASRYKIIPIESSP